MRPWVKMIFSFKWNQFIANKLKSNYFLNTSMPKLIKSEQAIKEKVELLAKQLNDDYKNIDILNIVCFLNGASLFCSDLIRLLKIPIKLHFLASDPTIICLRVAKSRSKKI